MKLDKCEEEKSIKVTKSGAFPSAYGILVC